MFSMEFGSFSVFVCALFYITCSSLFTFNFQNTTVNAQPLSPPIFEKIAPYCKRTVFYYLFICLRFHFFLFILLFRVPLASPWASPVTFLIDVGALFARCWYKLSIDEGGNDNTTPPFGKTFLRPCGIRASALNI